jgi:hypothetical protein
MRDWEADELPLLLMAFHHLIMGHFAVAPILEQVFEEDPQSAGAAERHGRFMRKLVRLMVFEEDSAAGRPEDQEQREGSLAAIG